MITKPHKILALFLLLTIMFVSCSKQLSPHVVKDDLSNVAVALPQDVFTNQNFDFFKESQINAGGNITVKMWINEDWKEIYTYLTDEYRKYRQNVTFDIVTFPWRTYWIKLRIALQSEDNLALFHMHPGYSRDFAPYLAELPEDYFPAEKMKTEFSRSQLTYLEGKRYFVGLGITTGGIFYNKTMWKQAGLSDKDIPQTWDQLNEIAKKLTQTDENGKIVVEGFNVNDTAKSLLFAMQMQRGISLFGDDGQAPNFYNAENIENLNFLRKLIFIDKISKGGDEPAKELFSEEKAAMIYTWAGVANDFDRFYPDLDYGFFRVPTWQAGTPPAYDVNNFECSFAVNTNAPNDQKAVAWDLLLFYLSNNEAIIKVAKHAQIVPDKKSIGNDDLKKIGPVVSIMGEYIDRTAFPGILPDEVFAYLSAYVDPEIDNEQIDASSLLQVTDETLREILRGYDFKSQLHDYPHFREFQQLK